MTVVFRVDASLEIGTGHVMRCLTLANGLREQGSRCVFICREHTGHLATKLEAAGHAVHLMPLARLSPAGEQDNASLRHSHWLGCDWQQDAADTTAVLDAVQCDWLVVDHYALDARWQSVLRPHAKRIMAIDDLADRPHQVDLLLDQNLGRKAEDYRPHVSDLTRCLIGPDYALLRPEFSQLRQYSLERRQHAPLRHILVSLGGVDRDNLTGRVLDILATVQLPREVEITVVLGRHSPGLDSVRAQAVRLPFPCHVRVDIDDMAQLMADCDLAIGAAGSSSWERCTLGLPSIALVTATNQREAAAAMVRVGAALVVKMAMVDTMLAPLVARLLINTTELVNVSLRASALVSGNGIEKVLHVMEEMT